MLGMAAPPPQSMWFLLSGRLIKDGLRILRVEAAANRISVEVLQFSSVTQSCPTL